MNFTNWLVDNFGDEGCLIAEKIINTEKENYELKKENEIMREKINEVCG